jgi:hypothetical protein
MATTLPPAADAAADAADAAAAAAAAAESKTRVVISVDCTGISEIRESDFLNAGTVPVLHSKVERGSPSRSTPGAIILLDLT